MRRVGAFRDPLTFGGTQVDRRPSSVFSKILEVEFGEVSSSHCVGEKIDCLLKPLWDGYVGQPLLPSKLRQEVASSHFWDIPTGMKISPSPGKWAFAFRQLVWQTHFWMWPMDPKFTFLPLVEVTVRMRTGTPPGPPHSHLSLRRLLLAISTPSISFFTVLNWVVILLLWKSSFTIMVIYGLLVFNQVKKKKKSDLFPPPGIQNTSRVKYSFLVWWLPRFTSAVLWRLS